MKSVFGTKELKPKLNAIALNPPGPRIRIFARGANLISTVCGGEGVGPHPSATYCTELGLRERASTSGGPRGSGGGWRRPAR